MCLKRYLIRWIWLYASVIQQGQTFSKWKDRFRIQNYWKEDFTFRKGKEKECMHIKLGKKYCRFWWRRKLCIIRILKEAAYIQNRKEWFKTQNGETKKVYRNRKVIHSEWRKKSNVLYSKLGKQLHILNRERGCCGRDCINLWLHMESVPIIINVVSSNPAQYTIMW